MKYIFQHYEALCNKITATEDESDVEYEAIKANSGWGLSAAGCSSAVSVNVCGHTPCLRLQGGSFWWGVRELFDCFVCTIRPLLELWEHSKAIVSNDCTSSDSLMNRLYYTSLYFFHSLCAVCGVLLQVPATLYLCQCSSEMILRFLYAWLYNVTAVCLSGLFQGDIQQLLILGDPQAAASYCVNYIPDCDSALPYNSHALEMPEVSIATSRRQCLLEKPMLIFVQFLGSSYHVALGGLFFLFGHKDWGIFILFHWIFHISLDRIMSVWLLNWARRSPTFTANQ